MNTEPNGETEETEEVVDGTELESEEPQTEAPGTEPASVEELILVLEATTRERDEFLDKLQRNQAEFENIRRRLSKQATEAGDRSRELFAEQLLPVLDACDSAMAHGSTDVEPVFAALLGALEKEGLERIDPAGEAFDPNLHEAVLHEPADEGDNEGSVVTEVLRIGYLWSGHTLRPAMVKVRG